MNRLFWKDKRVFLTGHTGFKGAWLSLWLQDCGAILTGYALAPNTKPNLFDAALVSDGMESIIGDVRDLETLTKAMTDFLPDVVIHMAAQPLVRLSYKNPVDTYSTNVMGTVNLLEAVRKTASVKAVVNVTTDKCYENKEWIWGYREDEPMGGQDPYSNSKGCSELVTMAYRRSFFNCSGSAKVASGRAGNVIGGGDWAEDRLIPDIFKSFEKIEPVVVRNPSATRPWQHVLEPLSGYLVLAERLYLDGDRYAEGWNFGPEDDDVKPVREVIEYLVERWGAGASWIQDESEQPYEAQLLKLDISKAKTLLGWAPKWSLFTTLDSIVEWHKEWRSGGDVKAITLEQIHKFEDLLGDF
ncbi:CDP-glucose 4,6-dehydratase [Pseudomonadales bacterium]|nr:CDP-glucose 4,6-dehydratase [Pseudomonadales bacterium]MDA8949870.1 CDP-glucose 4,6-dehydratase [Pseudomonadales bacterium]